MQRVESSGTTSQAIRCTAGTLPCNRTTLWGGFGRSYVIAAAAGHLRGPIAMWTQQPQLECHDRRDQVSVYEVYHMLVLIDTMLIALVSTKMLHTQLRTFVDGNKKIMRSDSLQICHGQLVRIT